MELLESSCVRPRQARYQAALGPDMKCVSHCKTVGNSCATPGGCICETRAAKFLFLAGGSLAASLDSESWATGSVQ